MTTALPDGLSAPARRGLTGAGIHTLEDVAGWREAELAALHGVGPTAIAPLRAALARAGRSFAPQATEDSDVRAIDDWIAELAPDHATSLVALRATLHDVLPHADEGWSYGMPAFVLQGTAVAGLGAATEHCTYAPMSGSVLDAVADDVAGYGRSEGVLRFPPGSVLPKKLVRKLVAARLAELSDVHDGFRREYHGDGRVKAEGRMKQGHLDGPWFWYRADGSLLRSGTFRAGEKVGTWTTYTRDGDPAGS